MESSTIPLATLKLFMISQLWDMVLKTEQNSGKLETVGVSILVRKDSLESLEESTILLLNLIVTGVCPKTPGLIGKHITKKQSQLTPNGRKLYPIFSLNP